MSARDGIAHLLRANSRFSARQGTQFSAAITYFSFLSLVPILMVAFSIAGFVLSGRPDLVAELKDQVTGLIPASLGDQIGAAIDQAVRQRLTVGIIGLLVAGYSGLSWMGNVRSAVRAQWRPHWDDEDAGRGNFLIAHLRDLLSLIGLAVAVVASFALTAVGTAAQGFVVDILGLGGIGWLDPVLRVGPFVAAILADVVIFAWVYTVLPDPAYRAGRRALLRGALAMAVVFEILKAALTILVTRMTSSPTGKAFGAVIGLLLFFNLVARAFLTIAAWIATAEMPGSDGASRRRTPPGPVTVTLREPAALRRPSATTAAAFALGWMLGRRRRR